MTTGTEADTAELSRLIEANLPLVKHIVFQVAVHFPRHVDRDELARAGALGLVEAARRYDGTRGCLLYTSPSPRDGLLSRMPSSA